MEITGFYVKLLNLTDYITSMNLDDSITSRYNTTIEFNLCLLRSKLLLLKEAMSRLQLVRRLRLIYNVPFGQFFIDKIEQDLIEYCQTIDYWVELLPSSKKANSYSDQITHIQTEWATLNNFIGK